MVLMVAVLVVVAVTAHAPYSVLFGRYMSV